MNRELIALLIETTLASGAALAVVLLLRRPMRSLFGAGAAYALWALVPVTLVAVLLPAPAHSVAMTPMAAMVGSIHAVQSEPGQGATPWASVLVVLWGLGLLATAGLLGWQQRRFVRRLGPVRQRAHGLQVAATSAGLPAVTGVLRPRIVLPADFLLRYDAAERGLVVAHERQHIARGDLPCNALAALLRCVYWFNPLLHWAVARYRHDQELACDARVLARHPRARRTYAQAMLKTQLEAFALPVGCHWHTHPLKERILMLKRPSPRRWQTGLSCVLLTALFAGFGYAAWAQQPAPMQADETQPQVGLRPKASPPVAHQGREAVAPIEAAKPPFGEDRPPPRYPAQAAQAGINGNVVVIAQIAADGHVTDARIETSRPAGVFDAVSLEAVRKWTFTPARKHGKPVAGRMRIPIEFSTDPSDEPPSDHGDAGAV